MKDVLRTISLKDVMSQARLRSAEPLPAAFYRRPTPKVARELLGKCIAHRIGGKFYSGLIVETEAYLSEDDPASHSASGPTVRNASMFSEAGTCYVYLSYGINFCMNVVTRRAGTGEAVLIRALRPVSMAEDMLRLRSLAAPGDDLARLPRGRLLAISNGPGKLTAALGISLADDQRDFFGSALKIFDCEIRFSAEEITSGPRIGISKAVDLPLRFSVADSPWVSRRAQTTQNKI